MDTNLTDTLRSAASLIVGGAIGLGFGLIQGVAHRRYTKRQEDGKLTSGWAVMPGSMSRVAFLLIALVLVQIPGSALFAGTAQWWVSAGVVGGYGALLFWQLRQRMMSAPRDITPRA